MFIVVKDKTKHYTVLRHMIVERLICVLMIRESVKIRNLGLEKYIHPYPGRRDVS
jgi:hypothetical protein